MLLAAREAGYRSLMRLSRAPSSKRPPNEPPRLTLDWLQGETEGVIALTGGPGGPLDMAIAAGQGHLAGAAPRCAAARCSATGSMSNCSATARRTKRAPSRLLIELAYAKGMPLVATNEPFFAAARRL